MNKRISMQHSVRPFLLVAILITSGCGSISTHHVRKLPGVTVASLDASCTSSTCPSGQTCCDSSQGPQCIPGDFICCCPDGVNYCDNGMGCDCSGSCPGPSCSCTACIPSPAGSCANSHNNPYCEPYKCAPDNTCCVSGTDQEGCCPHPDAACCAIGNFCCPSGMVCNPPATDPSQHCITPDDGPSCSSCLKAASWIIDQGCDKGVEELCDALDPALSKICGLLADAMCGWLFQDVLNKTNVALLGCSSITGDCNHGVCECGYCTAYTTGRCLSFPNHCPSGTVVNVDPHVSVLKGSNSHAHPDICFDGTCTEESIGCCLTCL